VPWQIQSHIAKGVVLWNVPVLISLNCCVDSRAMGGLEDGYKVIYTVWSRNVLMSTAGPVAGAVGR